MNLLRSLIGVSLLVAACSSGGNGSPDGEGSTGSGGGNGSGTGGRSPSGSGGTTPGSGGTTAGTGGAGGAGSGGSGGMTAGTGGAAMPASGQSVLQRGGDPGKTAHYVRPMMTKAKAAMLVTDAGFNAAYMGTVTGTPLYLENGPGGKGAFYVATQSNNVYAFDETTGAQIWMMNAGAPGQGGCDNQGKGIMSTPVIDVASRTLFAVAANPGLQFKVHAYDVDTGAEKAGGWPVDLKAVLGGADLSRSNQRGALLLAGGILYVPFGGQVGDCQNARGRVLAVNIADPTKTGSWSTGDDGSAIWGSGGIASDGVGVYAITGNHFPNFSAPAAHADSEEVVRLTGLAQLTRNNNNNIFFPSRWAAMDSADLDFGSNSPVVFDVPGATPGKYVAAPAKDGHLYFLDAANLGGMGAEKSDLVVAQQGSSLFTAPAAYQTTKGTFVALNVNGAHCPAGGPTGRVIMGISVGVNAGAINPTPSWCASDATATSPAVTTTDGKTDAVVWYVSGGALKGVDGETGASIFSGGACQVERWTAVIVGKGARIVSAGGGKLCSWSAM